MSFSQRLEEIRDGFEPAFWVANISEIFERLSYYGAFSSLANYLHESLNIPTEQTGSLAGLFGGMVWFLAILGGAVADRLGFRRALSLAYLILACAYFLLGSLGAAWMAPVRSSVPLLGLVAFVLVLPALGISMVKPSVVGTTARASRENVRSIGYSIYYTLVNIGGAAGPYIASWAHRHLGVENVFRVSALSVLLMFFAVLLFFKEPRSSGEVQTASLAETARNLFKVMTNPRFMLFLLIFSGYWIVFWQQYIVLPIYIHGYIDPHADVELILITDAATVICLQFLVTYLTQKIPAFRAITIGILISALGWLIVAFHPAVWAVVLSIFRGGARRNRSFAALLRIRISSCSPGPARDIHGLRVYAHWDRIARRRLAGRAADASLWGGGAAARASLVGYHRNRDRHDTTDVAVPLRSEDGFT